MRLGQLRERIAGLWPTGGSNGVPVPSWLEGVVQPELVEGTEFLWRRLLPETIRSTRMGAAIPRGPVSAWTAEDLRRIFWESPLGTFTPSRPSVLVRLDDLVALKDEHRGEDQRRITEADVRSRLRPNPRAVSLLREPFGSLEDWIDVQVDEATGTVTIRPKAESLSTDPDFSWQKKFAVYGDTIQIHDLVRQLDKNNPDDVEAFWHIATMWAALIIAKSDITFVIQGLNQLQTGQTYIFAPTHAGNIEFAFLLLMSVISHNRTGFVLKKEFITNPVLKRVVGEACVNFLADICFVIDRGSARKNRETTRAVALALSDPHSVHSLVWFPHGTRVKKWLDESGQRMDGRLGPLFPGIYHLARQTNGVPVVPVVMNGVGRVDTRNVSSRAQRGQLVRMLVTRPVRVPQSQKPVDTDRTRLMGHLGKVYRTYWESPARAPEEIAAMEARHRAQQMPVGKRSQAGVGSLVEASAAQFGLEPERVSQMTTLAGVTGMMQSAMVSFVPIP